MQYILTEKEYEDLKSKKVEVNREAEQANLDLIQDLCTMVADINFGCIRTKKAGGYCGRCPVLRQCPYNFKHFAK